MTGPAQAVLRRGPDDAVRQGHPWVFKGALASYRGPEACATPVEVFASNHQWLGRGLYHPGANLAIRLYSWRQEEAVGAELFLQRVDEALRLRADLPLCDPSLGETDAYRLVYSESDLLSGLVVDRYADVLAVHVRAKVLEPFLPAIRSRLRERTGLRTVHLAAAQDDAEREGIDPALLASLSDPLEKPVRIHESGLAYDADLPGGQKTGFYLDQRVNRRRVAAYARGRRVLSCYCYTGAFELHAVRAGAESIVGIDSSQPALDQAARHHELNPSSVLVRYEKADVPQRLRRFRDAAESFDLIILDPPRFVGSRAQKPKGLRAYKDINLLALKLLSPGGVLATFSCSGLVSREDFREAVRWAAMDAGRPVRLLEHLGQPPDHPVLMGFPESEYLKGLIAQVT